ncbi:branched-chain amino acid transport system II carrier protein [Pseudomonas sp. F1_0610]|uniref:branched-chain amino acid transport system II carrier protein n=1 Tax=Pseudomonas sp. F1_0610 TaxID=3114284 RepID=UPI0039C1D14F
MKRLNGFELLALGFMTFALFLGAGNIIFPVLIGMQAGEYTLVAGLGFLITGVSLPLLTVVALARVGGGLTTLTSPLGKTVGLVFAISVYLSIGPLFATPRTANASFVIGITPFFEYLPFVDAAQLADKTYKDNVANWTLWIYSTIYFLIVLYLVLSPGKIIDRLGKIITPVLLLGLIVLGCAAVFAPAGPIGPVSDEFSKLPMLGGFLNGYLTMDALGALVYGLVIANAIRSKGVNDKKLITRYSIYAGIIAAIGLSLVYLTLIYLGAGSYSIASGVSNGGDILALYVNHTFGYYGNFLLALVMVLACLTTAVGLITACGEFFNDVTGIPYTIIAIAFTLFSWLVSNVGLEQLLSFSAPVLTGLYPLAIVITLLALADGVWNYRPLIYIPTLFVTLLFGIVDGLNAAGLNDYVPRMFDGIFAAEVKMGWLLPVCYTVLAAFILDRYAPRAIDYVVQQANKSSKE